jgi:hypothetical protein
MNKRFVIGFCIVTIFFSIGMIASFLLREKKVSQRILTRDESLSFGLSQKQFDHAVDVGKNGISMSERTEVRGLLLSGNQVQESLALTALMNDKGEDGYEWSINLLNEWSENEDLNELKKNSLLTTILQRYYISGGEDSLTSYMKNPRSQLGELARLALPKVKI